MAKSVDPGYSEELGLKDQSATLIYSIAGKIKCNNACKGMDTQ